MHRHDLLSTTNLQYLINSRGLCHGQFSLHEEIMGNVGLAMCVSQSLECPGLFQLEVRSVLKQGRLAVLRYPQRQLSPKASRWSSSWSCRLGNLDFKV
jgi:hypothetical protein